MNRDLASVYRNVASAYEQLGGLRQANEYGGSAVPEMEALRQRSIGGGSGQVPVSGGEFSITVEVQVVFDITE